MLEPRLMHVSLWLFPGLFTAVWVGIPVVVSIVLRVRCGLGPREQRVWMTLYYIPTSALFAWLIGFGLLESLGFGLLVIPVGIIGSEMFEAAARLGNVEHDPEGH